LKNKIHECSRKFRNKKREYLKDKIDELATNSKNKNIRDLYRGMLHASCLFLAWLTLEP
jgi:hypothetical protein